MYEPIFLHKALKYDEKKHSKLLKDRWIQEKLDGVGAQVVFNKDSIEIYAMTKAAVSGEFSNWTQKLPHLIEELDELQFYSIPCDSIFEGIIQGELVVDYFDTGNENFGFVSGTLHADDAIARQGENYKLKFIAYELPSCDDDYRTRYHILSEMFKATEQQYHLKYISLNPVLAINDIENKALEQCFNDIVGKGREGVVLYDADCKYKRSEKSCQRNKGLLKIKAENECEVMCINMIEGEGKYTGTLGAMVCQDADGRQFNIGSFSISDEERANIWNTMKTPFLVEMVYFEQTPDSYKLPRFKRVRQDKPTSDWNKADVQKDLFSY